MSHGSTIRTPDFTPQIKGSTADGPCRRRRGRVIMAASVGKRGIMSVLDSARASLSPGGHIKASDSDTWILGVMITSLLVMGPLQPVLFDSLIHGEIATPETAPEEWLSEDRMILVLWLSEDRMILVFRVLQGVGLLGGLLGLRRRPA